MKSLKVLACAACLLGTVSSVGFAKDVQTIAGSMVVPNNVNVVSASKTNTRDFVEKQLNEEPSKSTMSNMMAKEFSKILVLILMYTNYKGQIKLVKKMHS